MSEQVESFSNKDKILIYITSLWLLFLLLIVLTIDIPICFSKEYSFIGFKSLFFNNLIPTLSLIFLLIGIIYTFRFKYKFSGANPLQVKVIRSENINYQHIVFLTTYIIPFIGFNLDKTRYIISLIILLIAIGIIYVKTNLFYANPTLALLGYRIYEIDATRKNNNKTEKYDKIIIIIKSKKKIELNKDIKLKRISENIYFGRMI